MSKKSPKKSPENTLAKDKKPSDTGNSPTEPADLNSKKPIRNDDFDEPLFDDDLELDNFEDDEDDDF